MTTITLKNDGRVKADITDYYDGEYLTISVARGGRTGTLVLTIDEHAGGQSTKREAKFEFVAGGANPVFDIPPIELSAMKEAAPYTYNIWELVNDTRASLAAFGTVEKQSAIRPTGALIGQPSELSVPSAFSPEFSREFI